jgi:hypothetical protein
VTGARPSRDLPAADRDMENVLLLGLFVHYTPALERLSAKPAERFPERAGP